MKKDLKKPKQLNFKRSGIEGTVLASIAFWGQKATC